jgi:hypothetical protein
LAFISTKHLEVRIFVMNFKLGTDSNELTGISIDDHSLHAAPLSTIAQ